MHERAGEQTDVVCHGGEYKPKFAFSGGRVIKVIFDLAKDQYVDVEKAFAAAMARD